MIDNKTLGLRLEEYDTTKSFEPFLYPCRTGVCKLQPEGHMRPANTFYVACQCLKQNLKN